MSRAQKPKFSSSLNHDGQHFQGEVLHFFAPPPPPKLESIHCGPCIAKLLDAPTSKAGQNLEKENLRAQR